MNTDIEQEMQELADMPRIHKRMDAVAQHKKIERRINIITVLLTCLLIAAVAWAVGASH